MSNETNTKKLLLGSALAGLMVAAPGLSVTTGKFFQTASLKVGYGLAQAAQVDDTTTEGDPATRGKKVTVTEPESQPTESKPTETKTEKKGDKSCSASGCGAGSCGSGK